MTTMNARRGTCLSCGEPVAAHFDDRNVKHDCEMVRQLLADERASLETKEKADARQQ